MTILTKEQLLAHLDDIRAKIANNISFEGSLTYTTCHKDLQPNQFKVEGVYSYSDPTGRTCVSAISNWSWGSGISPLSNTTVSSLQKQHY